MRLSLPCLSTKLDWCPATPSLAKVALSDTESLSRCDHFSPHCRSSRETKKRSEAELSKQQRQNIVTKVVELHRAGNWAESGGEHLSCVLRVRVTATWCSGAFPPEPAMFCFCLVTLGIRYGLLRPCRWRSTCDRGHLLKR